MSTSNNTRSTSDPTPEELALQKRLKEQLKEHLKQLSRAIVRKPPYCQGTIHLPADDFTLFYGKDAIARCVFHFCPAEDHAVDQSVPAV